MKRNKILIPLIIAIFVCIVWGMTHRDCKKPSMEEQGDIFYAQGNYTQSIILWKGALTADTDNIQLMKKIANGFLRLAKLRQAEAFFEKILSINFNDIGSHMELFRICLLKNDLPGAEKRCTLLKKMAVFHPELDILQGDFFVLTNQPGKAEAYYRKAFDSAMGSGRILLKLATCLVVLEKKTEAYQLFALAEKIENRSTSFLLQMADFCLVADEAEKVEAYLLEAVALEPGDLWLKNRLAQFYLSAGKPEKAENILKVLVDADPENVQFNLMLADLHISLNRIEMAGKIISDMGGFIREPVADYELLQGKYWLYKGNPVYAATYLKTAVSIIPGSSLAHYLLGMAYLLGGQNQLAENSFEQALFIEPRQSRATLLMAVVSYKKGDHRLSLEYLNGLLSKEPENYRAHMVKGLNLIAGEEYEKAVGALGAAYSLNSDCVFPLYFTGMAWELSGKAGKAGEFYRIVLDREPQRADVLFRYTMLLIKTGETERAETVLKETLGAFPENPFINYVAARVALSTGDFAGAEQYLKTTLALNSALGYAYIKLAELYEQQGKIEKASDILHRCITNIPSYGEGWIGLAGHLVGNGDPAVALDVMKRAEEKLPQAPEILANLAWLYVQTGSDLDLALDFARRAYSRSPNHDAIADTLAWVYYKKGAYAQAAWILSDLEKRLADNSVVVYHYGMTLYKQEKYSQAAEKLRTAVAGTLSEDDRAIAGNVLSELESIADVTLPSDSDF
ncbi:MAG: tetratricopeptide repeat protein [Desulfobacteraceae bacterium]|nr:tetratricopeptide repeat protein [Desulfobacteraceae bacterium]